jgi:hypothetical protein
VFNSAFTITTKVTAFPELISKVEVYITRKSNGSKTKYVANLLPNGDYEFYGLMDKTR